MMKVMCIVVKTLTFILNGIGKLLENFKQIKAIL